MLKTSFITRQELDFYVAEQKIRKESGYLTRSEREQLQRIIDAPEMFINTDIIPKGKPIVTNYQELRVPSQEVLKTDDIKGLLKDLKETLIAHGSGVGISAVQIGVYKQVAYIRLPHTDEQGKPGFKEIVLVNPKIVEKNRSFVHKDEGCLSLPGIWVDTVRYNDILVESGAIGEDRQTKRFFGSEALVIQHEVDHCQGITMLERKR